MRPRLKEGAFIALLAAAAYLTLALVSFNPQDPGWTYTGASHHVANLMGPSGAWVADVLLFFFGYLSYLFPWLLAHQAWIIFRGDDRPSHQGLAMFMLRGLGLLLIMAAGATLAAMHFYGLDTELRAGSGGLVGSEAANFLVAELSYLGATLLTLALFLFGLTAFLDISWLMIMELLGRFALALSSWLTSRMHRLASRSRDRAAARKSAAHRREALEKTIAEQRLKQPPVIEPPPVQRAPESKRASLERQGSLFKAKKVDSLPALHLLDADGLANQGGYSNEDLEAMSRLLELKLKDYGVQAEVVAVFPGPVITRFEIQPAPGVKVSRISGLAKDLARSLAVVSVRVVEVIPGKSVVGIEIPNVDREVVQMGEVLKSSTYDQSSSPLSLALGHDIAGKPVVEDLARMPHLLVAGTTGSGKSVGLNAMILSVLFKASPEDVRMIMVDPKMLELAVYEGIPHLLTPVVTDMKDAANALRWCVAEMERRYRLMATLGVRNLSGFNRKVRDAKEAGEPLIDPLWIPNPVAQGSEQERAPELEPLPLIVVVIDEFADMMMIVGKKVEELIARIAQKARAAGIHLVLATQRPSVDVITGLIKANIPTRIAFQVSSKVDSRTILDQGGAEQLLGHGDMLYLPAGSPLPMRVHGAFVSDEEVHRVVESWKELAEPNYLDNLLDGISEGELLPGVAGAQAAEEEGDESDPLYDEAVQFVTESRRASISSVQRKLRIGYNRAARMIEMMEVAGVVSPMNANGTRDVLANPPPE